ncbi:DNA cytosine methyltransferase [Cellulophaga sp. BC115SP]|uniref:DNA cytosine methyltransferase n=1 Tax=Cellulophaga sp. BC115SP TaxID=2683263 RepID=UPI0014123192|nr:DNA cytosine methyltransferase [Cellulophaga sp. BC115SP]NBB29163.1 DNA (cytosine-5-)-methyltransferase [Cellulophaga sp. BC115SP]
MIDKKIYIDLFAGCGGLSLGLYNSGLWKGKFAVEKSPDAFETLQYNLIEKKNHFEWPDWLPKQNHDINEVIKKYKDNLKLLRGEIDLVAGGPPCQGFSTAGRRIEGDSRNELIKSYIKFIRLVQPKVIFFENVKGFTQKFDKNKIKGKIYSEYVTNALEYDSPKGDFQGYKVEGKLIDFSEFGVPQKRTRFILVGIRKDIVNQVNPIKFFEHIQAEKEVFLINKEIGLTNSLEDAISDLLKVNEIVSPDTKSFSAGLYNPIKSGYQKLLRKKVDSEIPDSHRFAKHSEETLRKFEFILQNAEKNKTLSKELKDKFNLKKRTVIPLSGKTPTPTITTLPDDYIHYCEPRIFTVREYARIQSFNDWYEFKGKYTTGGKRRTQEVPRYSQIGNAIPPLFGEQVGLILNKLF